MDCGPAGLAQIVSNHNMTMFQKHVQERKIVLIRKKEIENASSPTTLAKE